MTTRLMHLGLALLLAVSASTAQAVTYIGDAASQGSTFNAAGGPRADTVNILTYFSTGAGNLYTATSTVKIRLVETNFYADTGGTVRPFVALYNGGNNQLGASYTILAKGDTIIVTPEGALGPDFADHLVNAGFGGPNDEITLNPGDVLGAGWLQSSNVVYISGLAGSGTPDYIANGDTLTAAAIGGPLTGNSSFAFDRTMQFNVGFVIIPEPATATLGVLSLGGLGVLIRRRRP